MPTIKKNQIVSKKSKPDSSNEKYSTDSTGPTNAQIRRQSNKTQKKECLSDITVSIQSLEFPDTKSYHKTGAYRVKGHKNVLTKPQPKVMQSPKERGNDFSSSTNSHFAQMLLTVPKKFRSKCISSTSTQAQPSPFSVSPKSSKQFDTSAKSTSTEMVDKQHTQSEKRMNLHGAEWKRPCKESLVAGAPRKFTGTCPPNYEQMSKMSKTRQKFYLTQDPRKVHCLVNPEILRSKEHSMKKEFNTLTKMVKHAQNICAATASESSEDFICEVIDLENPLQLDFQGLDYSNTYEKDEQDLQNQRNYHRICRNMERRRVKVETENKVEDEIHSELVNVNEKSKTEMIYN